MADPTTDDVLTFTTQVPKRHIVIDKRSYPLRRMLDLHLDQHLFVERTMPTIGRLMTSVSRGTASTADKSELSNDLRRIVDIAVEAPPRVLGRLSDAHRLEICRVFLELPLPRLAKPEAKTTSRASRSTGASASRT